MDKDDYYRRHLALYMASLGFGAFLIGVFIFSMREPILLAFGILYSVLSFIGIIYFSESEKN